MKHRTDLSTASTLIVVMLLATVGCGGGGGPASPGSPEAPAVSTFEGGGGTVRSTSELRPPAITVGTSATAIGLSGQINGFEWRELDETTREEVAAISPGSGTGEQKLQLGALNRRFQTISVVDDVALGPTAFVANGNAILFLKKGSNNRVQLMRVSTLGDTFGVVTRISVGNDDVVTFTVAPTNLGLDTVTYMTRKASNSALTIRRVVLPTGSDSNRGGTFPVIGGTFTDLALYRSGTPLLGSEFTSNNVRQVSYRQFGSTEQSQTLANGLAPFLIDHGGATDRIVGFRRATNGTTELIGLPLNAEGQQPIVLADPVQTLRANIAPAPTLIRQALNTDRLVISPGVRTTNANWHSGITSIADTGVCCSFGSMAMRAIDSNRIIGPVFPPSNYQGLIYTTNTLATTGLGFGSAVGVRTVNGGPVTVSTMPGAVSTQMVMTVVAEEAADGIQDVHIAPAFFGRATQLIPTVAGANSVVVNLDGRNGRILAVAMVAGVRSSDNSRREGGDVVIHNVVEAFAPDGSPIPVINGILRMAPPAIEGRLQER
ncbi:MAG: hypothetical protein ACK4XJ_03340 [Fimbriimonadaceae bacterium]